MMHKESHSKMTAVRVAYEDSETQSVLAISASCNKVNYAFFGTKYAVYLVKTT